MRYALINHDTQEIKNIIIWDGVSPFEVEAGYTLELATEAHEAKWNEQNAPIVNNNLTIEEQETLQALLSKYMNANNG